MCSIVPPRRPLLMALAWLFAGLVVLYSALWMRAVRRDPTVNVGLEGFSLDSSEALLRVQEVLPGSPAARAGLRRGDAILAIDGARLNDLAPLAHLAFEDRPGQRVSLLVRPAGHSSTVEMTLVTEPPVSRSSLPLTRRLLIEALNSYPVLFVVVSTTVLLLRVDGRDTWLLALLFASFIAAAPALESQTHPGFRGFVLVFRTFFGNLGPGLFLYFFSVFPAPSPLERRAPWLKNLWLTLSAALALLLTLWALTPDPPPPVSAWPAFPKTAFRVFQIGGYLLGFIGLVWTAFSGALATRRKSRVILTGTLMGFGPSFLMFASSALMGSSPYDRPFWLWASCVIALALMPLSFAYAVVKHQVLEIPALLRIGARYLLVQRGFLFLLVALGMGATLLFARTLSGALGPGSESVAIGLGTGFGSFLVLGGSRLQRRVREKIDQAFFRGAYDARQILQDLAERARTATSRDDLAALLAQQVQSALLPASLALYVENHDGVLTLARGSMPEEWHSLAPTLPLMSELLRRGQPRAVGDSLAFAPLAALGAEALVPLLARDGHLNGVLVLGPRLSDEPYSRDDKRLLASVAGQAGIALDSIHLAERMAERLEADRSADHEMSLAKQVQGRLLPQHVPLLRTVECAGRCVQARAVGGDYYDFIDLSAGRVALALADVSGKGFPAALLMASLQASLRSRLSGDRLDLPQQLSAVNDLLYRTSETNRYATLFLGVYDDATRRLRYANCGHNPPMLLRAGGGLERLPPTSTALGLFEDWSGGTAEIDVAAGDLLVLFSDGISEAFSDDGEEFGEDRLVETLLACQDLPADEVVDVVLDVVTRFSGTEQEDDKTLVVARGL